MVEEFKHYGMPDGVVYIVGFCKVTLAVLILVGIFIPGITTVSTSILALFMAGAVTMHIKVKDTIKKTLPSLVILSLCLYVVWSLL
jgi:hypothetical protein